ADVAPSSYLTLRVDIVLHALRNQGLSYALDGASPPDQGDKLTWFAIRPEIREMLVKDGQLGFVSGSPATSISPDILIPALGALQPPDLVGYATEFVEREPGVEQIRLSFTRRTLDSSWDGQLVKAMNMGFGELMSVIRDDSLGSAAMLRFLTLWVVRRTGWKIDVTAGIRPGHEPARAALELLGREVYDTDCSIEPAASLSSAPSAPERLDLVTCYPDGWVFPPFLPPPDMIDRMNLERLHNPSLPSLPRDGLLVGFADGAEVRLPLASRDRHTYIVGATGTGKSTLLTRMIRHDIEAGEAVVLLDPHGDLYADVLAGIPTERKGDVVTLDPNRDEDPIGFNLLDVARDALFDRR
ncbi:MAG: DUF853 family protein, partial [Kiritimatiellae bacterium]|nr:DUF853 family protein [Kiritimatiellia bacterium]